MEQAIAALLAERNQAEAARVAGVGIATLLRWHKLPEFQAAYRDAKRAAFSQSIARLHHMSSAAVSTLGKIMVDVRRFGTCCHEPNYPDPSLPRLPTFLFFGALDFHLGLEPVLELRAGFITSLNVEFIGS